MLLLIRKEKRQKSQAFNSVIERTVLFLEGNSEEEDHHYLWIMKELCYLEETRDLLSR